jgi:hypothetical protein
VWSTLSIQSCRLRIHETRSWPSTVADAVAVRDPTVS